MSLPLLLSSRWQATAGFVATRLVSLEQAARCAERGKQGAAQAQQQEADVDAQQVALMPSRLRLAFLVFFYFFELSR